MRIGRGDQGRDRPVGVSRVPFLQIPGKGAKISIHSFFYQLLIPTFGPDLRARCQEHLERGIREDDRAHVPAVGDQSRGLTEGPLAREERRSDCGKLRDLRGSLAALLGAYLVINVLFFKKDFITVEGNLHPRSDLRESLFVRNAAPIGRQGDQAVQRSALQVMEAEHPGDPLGDGPLAGGGGPIDGDDRRFIHRRFF